jgi:hypothetical protein
MFTLNFAKKRPITPAPAYTPPQGLPGRPAPQQVVDAGRGDEWAIKEQQRIQKAAMQERFRNSVRADRGGLGSLPSPLYAATMMRATAGVPGAFEQAQSFHPGLSENTLAMKSAMKTGLPYVDEARYLNPEMADAYTRSTQTLPNIQLEQDRARQEIKGLGLENAKSQILNEQLRPDMEQARQLRASEEQRTQEAFTESMNMLRQTNPLKVQELEQAVMNGQLTYEQALNEAQLDAQYAPMERQQQYEKGQQELQTGQIGIQAAEQGLPNLQQNKLIEMLPPEERAEFILPQIQGQSGTPKYQTTTGMIRQDQRMETILQSEGTNIQEIESLMDAMSNDSFNVDQSSLAGIQSAIAKLGNAVAKADPQTAQMIKNRIVSSPSYSLMKDRFMRWNDLSSQAFRAPELPSILQKTVQGKFSGYMGRYNKPAYDAMGQFIQLIES